MPRGRCSRWDEDQEFIEEKIQYWSRRIAGRSPRAQPDRDDLAQELRLHLLRRRPNYDPRRASRRTFISRILENRAKTIAQQRRARRRGHGIRHLPLDAGVDSDGADPIALQEILSLDRYLELTGRGGSDQEVKRDLVIDVRRALGGLSGLEAAVCRLLGEMTKTEAALVLGIPRTTLQDIVRRIAKKLKRVELEGSYK